MRSWFGRLKVALEHHLRTTRPDSNWSVIIKPEEFYTYKHKEAAGRNFIDHIFEENVSSAITISNGDGDVLDVRFIPIIFITKKILMIHIEK